MVHGRVQSVWVGGCARGGRRARAGGRSVSRDEEYLTNSRSAGLGCARVGCWRRRMRMKDIYRHGIQCWGGIVTVTSIHACDCSTAIVRRLLR